MPLSAPRNIGTAPAFYNWLKNSRPGWPGPGQILDNGTLIFDHAVGISDITILLTTPFLIFCRFYLI